MSFRLKETERHVHKCCSRHGGRDCSTCRNDAGTRSMLQSTQRCHVSCISLVPYTETDVRSQVHNLHFLNLKQLSGRTNLQYQKEILKFKFQNSKMSVSKRFTPVFLRATTTAMRTRFVLRPQNNF